MIRGYSGSNRNTCVLMYMQKCSVAVVWSAGSNVLIASHFEGGDPP